MNLQEFKVEVNNKLSEVNAKILDVKNSLEKERQNKKLDEALKEMESIREDILKQKDELDALKSSEETELKEFRKNIFNSLESFDESFKAAGTMIKPRKFRRRDRSVDFKNPLDSE